MKKQFWRIYSPRLFTNKSPSSSREREREKKTKKKRIVNRSRDFPVHLPGGRSTTAVKSGWVNRFHLSDSQPAVCAGTKQSQKAKKTWRRAHVAEENRFSPSKVQPYVRARRRSRRRKIFKPAENRWFPARPQIGCRSFLLRFRGRRKKTQYQFVSWRTGAICVAFVVGSWKIFILGYFGTDERLAIKRGDRVAGQIGQPRGLTQLAGPSRPLRNVMFWFPRESKSALFRNVCLVCYEEF